MYRPKAEIHLSRLRANYQKITALAGNSRILAAVKADAYGHGLLEISQCLADEGVYGFCIALLSEGLALREAGLELPILHMGKADPDDLPVYVAQNIMPTIHEADDLTRFVEFVQQGGKPLSVHLKVDTGMGRLGVPFESVPTVFEQLAASPAIELDGLYTHFATADEAEPSFFDFQLHRFNQLTHLSKKMGLDIQYFHCANSGALIREFASHFNMVRPGLLLYGVRPRIPAFSEIEVEPVMDLKAPLVAVKTIPLGGSVGYGRMFRADKATRIGILQIGYADGVPTQLYRGGGVEIGERWHRILGRVSMDTIAIDLGDADYKPPREALIWGLGGMKTRVEAQAQKADTTPYDLLTRVGNRVEKIFIS